MKPTQKPKVRTVQLDQIRIDAGVQTRVQVDDETIGDYAQAMLGGAIFPAVVLFQAEPTAEFIVVDGFHRIASARKAGLTEILAEVRQGDRRAATAYALGSNAQHGLRRTNADKRRCVEIALREFSDHSDRRLAEMCCVTDSLIRSIRTQVQDSRTSSLARRVGKDGKTYPSNPRPTIARKAALSQQQQRDTQAQVQPACSPGPSSTPAEFDAQTSCETPGDHQMMNFFRQLVEKAVTIRPDSAPFYRARIAAMGAWLDAMLDSTGCPKPDAPGL